MSDFRSKKVYFSKSEKLLWGISVFCILVSFLLFDRTHYQTLVASMIGVTSLILNAKGNPIGQLLMVVFSLLYGLISFSFAYYGEMLTYLGMTLPMSVFALVSWLRHPYHGKRSEVKVNRIGKREAILMWIPAILVTVGFWFLLDALHTSNLVPSTISVTTSFMAVYLSFRRSPYFALAYACNDLVLIVLWVLASMTEICYLSVVVCFCAFLVNDLYGFLNWRKMENRQAASM